MAQCPNFSLARRAKIPHIALDDKFYHHCLELMEIMRAHKRNGNVPLFQPERRKIDQKIGMGLKKFTNLWKVDRKSGGKI
jgi:hypothetical protein